MTAPALAAPTEARPATDERTAWTRVLAAGLALLCCYVAASFLMNPKGYLGTDTGGKVATLHVMHGTDPDLGYWAERWDPEGTLHPLWYTTHVGDRWVNVTTLPMLEAGKPLYDLGGERAALLLPMLGAVATAFAARALARRLGSPERGWVAFWVVGLASPVAIYALDFWEHTIGLALLGWAAVALLDVVERRAGWRAALLAGLAIGTAATMRTEALAYGAVWVAIAAALRLRDRSLRTPIAIGTAAAVGVLVPLLGNLGLERAVLGQSLRTGRATGTVLDATATTGSRVVEALVTFLSPLPTLQALGWLFGAFLLALLVFITVRTAGVPDRDPLPVFAAALLVVVVNGIVRSTGLGFVPGLVAATPLAAVALAIGWRSPAARPALAFALLPLPVVWRFQFTGGAPPQWAGRYILATGLLLAVVGICALPRLVTWARIGAIALSAWVTLTGVAWLHERSGEVASAISTLDRRPEDVIVSRVHHLAREGGATYGDRRWLTAITDADVERAASVVKASGGTSFALVSDADGGAPPLVAGFEPGAPTEVHLFSGVDLDVVPYVAE